MRHKKVHRHCPGALLLESGERDEGERILLNALERADKLAEGEASLLLGRLYRKEGNEAKARTYLERAAARKLNLLGHASVPIVEMGLQQINRIFAGNLVKAAKASG